MAQPEVTIHQGTLRGTTGTDLRGGSFFKFKGIPYAKPPLGDLRFKAPVPPEKWSGVLDATQEGNACYARDPLRNGKISGSENCLFLNVYTKGLQGDNLRPVLFWIHGGAFRCGDGGEELYGPDFLLTEDIVLVTINYRLGILGFLSLEDPSLDVPGNAGLKDQVMALTWVQKNIDRFGGDPKNVTIFGESSGGTSAHLHLLSTMSKGLFHKAIAQSGCALGPRIPNSTLIQKLAQALNLEHADQRTIYGELMKKTVEEIFEIQDKVFLLFGKTLRLFSFVVEKNSKEPFLPYEPKEIISSGNFSKVPFMLGYNSAEGMLFDLFKIELYQDLVPAFLGYKHNTPEIKLAAEKIKKFYFGDEEPSSNIRKKYDLLSDCFFLNWIFTSVKSHCISETPVYLYRMSIETELNFFKKLLKIETPGVCHCDDVGYLFRHFATPEIKPGSVEDVSLARFVKLWTNFAKFGNPTLEKNDPLLKIVWRPVTGSNFDYLDIGHDLVSSSNPPEAERISFWEKMVAESPAGSKVY